MSELLFMEVGGGSLIWTLVPLLALAGIIVSFVARRRQLKREEEDLRRRLADYEREERSREGART